MCFLRRFVSELLFFALFFLVLFPFAIIRRLFGKKYVSKKFDKTLPSYWVIKENNWNSKDFFNKQN